MLVEKLGKLLEARYGTGLEIKNILSHENVVRDNWVQKTSYWVGEQLHIPLRKNNAVLGTAVVTKAKNLSEEAQRNIADLVQFILEPEAYNANLKTVINNLEHQTNFSEKETSSDSNVFTLFRSNSPPDEFEESDLEEPIESNAFITSAIHLFSQNLQSRIKIAHAVHELSQRWIFVFYTDIREEIKSVEDIKQMGQTTIFIPNLVDLTLTEQKILGEYLNSEIQLAQEPLILIGSNYKFSEITEAMSLHESLKSDLLGFYLDIDTIFLSDPDMNYQKILDILDLMFLKEI